MARFIKSMLRCGTYQSPDGPVVITPSRLRTWKHNFQRMNQTGYRVPMSWDHADNLEDAVPVKMGADPHAARSAKNTAGLVTDFRIAADGKSAELVIDAEGRAAEQARSNRVFISPVIFPNWKDGAGQEYRDVITHVDFVDHPVDHKQKPFREVISQNATPIVACALRMGLTAPIRMGTAMFDAENDDTGATGDELDMAEAGDEGATDEANEGGEQTPPADDKASDPRLEVVTMFLTDLGLNLPEIKSGDDLISVLYRTASGDTESPTGGDGTGSQSSVVDPGMQAMSLRVKSLEETLAKQAKAALTADIGRLLKTGRCTKAEHDAQLAKLGAVRMSVNSDGTPKETAIGVWVEARKGLPVATFHGGKAKTRMGVGRGTDEIVEPPSFDDAPTEAQADALATSILGY